MAQARTLVGDILSQRILDAVTLENLRAMRQIVEEHIAGPDAELAAHLKHRGFA